MRHNLWIKRGYLGLFSHGKNLEIRPGTERFRKIRVGDEIFFNEYPDGLYTVKAIRHYLSFLLMLEEEDVHRIFPGDIARKKEIILRTLRTLYPPKIESQAGVLVFELKSKA